MLLQSLSINNFKNIAEARLEFSPKVNCFLGNNGMGKSNLLDAVYYLSFCKSFSGVHDSLLLKRGEEYSLVQGRYLRRDIEEELSLGFAKNKRKSLKRKGKEYQKLSTHIGSFPLVMVSPQDIDLIRGGSEERRRFMDMVISQSDHRYLDELIRYNRCLEQRNKLLRDGAVDHGLYLAVEITMSMAAEYINKARRQWVEQLTVMFDKYYRAIAGDNEIVHLSYRSSLNGEGVTMETLLDEARRHDEIVKYTTVGPHRDDIEMELSGMPMRRTGSQGQCKTYTIALRLAQYDFLHQAAGMKPLLLLDDIFDKLDASRVERIMEVVTQSSFGQIFITDTNRTHLDEIMTRTGGDYRMWEVADGCFEPIASTIE
ncbi:MAG: DNA replication and repair protein RecF [Muribaculaceae bacterium]|nr:DNA replication and repair protein RecF [Muribaculaceae bacterium]